MNTRSALLISLLLSVIAAPSAQAQVQFVTANSYLSASLSRNVYRPVIPVQAIYLPSPAFDAVDTADATRNQYDAEDEFQTMAIGF